MAKLSYRPEIDGLRAIAVGVVLLYHLGLGVPGGYVGVDVFFVISGFLITTLVVADIAAGEFGLAQFWERRVRRIAPALLLVLTLTTVVSWFMLVPADFDAFGRSLTYESLLLSNVFFWKTTNYFGSSDTQPLLHTWSLAVEEQFYLLFPVLLMALTRLGRARLRVWLGLIACASFAWSLRATVRHPVDAFYLLPARAWELLVGAVLAMSGPVRARAWIREILGWLGATLILAASLHYDSETRFPGAAALPPCLGAALIIWSNFPAQTSLGKVLSLRPFVLLGLCSYALYLWHWPVLIFAKYWSPVALSKTEGIALAALSLVLALGTWRFVETPFRRRRVLARRPLLLGSATLALLVFFSVGRVIHRQDGLPARFRPDALAYIDASNDKAFERSLRQPTPSPVTSSPSARREPIGRSSCSCGGTATPWPSCTQSTRCAPRRATGARLPLIRRHRPCSATRATTAFRCAQRSRRTTPRSSHS
ncbi:MAG TPA: acyltransferase [Polyangiaceae bacterium]|jgi:peptidoglycan/LPS O-acetylase OafA/YrhL|nr:acyltransferase [Polyangiaceae bacterium]